MTEKLGPCPLCGGEAKHLGTCGVECSVLTCSMAVCSPNVWNQLSTLAAREKRMREENELLIWNLAGCSTIATSEKPQEFNQDMARPALHDVNSMAIKFQRMREALERCRRTLGFLHVCSSNAGLLLPADEEKYQDVCRRIYEALKGGEG